MTDTEKTAEVQEEASAAEQDAEATGQEAVPAEASDQPQDAAAEAGEADGDDFGDFDEAEAAPPATSSAAAVPDAPDDDDDFGDFSSEPTPAPAPAPPPAPVAQPAASSSTADDITGLQGAALVKAISSKWATAFGQQQAPPVASSLDDAELQVLQAAQQQAAAASAASSCDSSLRYGGLPLPSVQDTQPSPRLSGVPSWRDSPSEARLLQSLGLSEVAAQAKLVEAAEAAAAARARAGAAGAPRVMASVGTAGQAPWTAIDGPPLHQEPLTRDARDDSHGGPAWQQATPDVVFTWSDEQEESAAGLPVPDQQQETDGRPLAPLPAAQFVLQRLGERHTYMGWRDDLRAWEDIHGVVPASVLAEVSTSVGPEHLPSTATARVYVPADPAVIPTEDPSGPDLLGDELEVVSIATDGDGSWGTSVINGSVSPGSYSYFSPAGSYFDPSVSPSNPGGSPGAAALVNNPAVLTFQDDSQYEASLPLPPLEPLAVQEVLGVFRRTGDGPKSDRGTPRSDQQLLTSDDPCLEAETELDRALHLAVTALDEATATAAAVVACMAAVEQLSTSTTAVLESAGGLVTSRGGGNGSHGGGGRGASATSACRRTSHLASAAASHMPRVYVQLHVTEPQQGSGSVPDCDDSGGVMLELVVCGRSGQITCVLQPAAVQLSTAVEEAATVQLQLTVVDDSGLQQDDSAQKLEEVEVVVRDELFGVLRFPRPEILAQVSAADVAQTLDVLFSSQLVSALRSMSSRVAQDVVLPDVDPLDGLTYDQAARVAAHALELQASRSQVDVPPLEAAQAAALLEALERGRFYELVNDLGQQLQGGNRQKPKSMIEEHEDEVIRRHWEWVAWCEAEAAAAEVERQQRREAERVAAELAAAAAAEARALEAERQVVTAMVSQVFGSVIQAELCGSYIHLPAVPTRHTTSCVQPGGGDDGDHGCDSVPAGAPRDDASGNHVSRESAGTSAAHHVGHVPVAAVSCASLMDADDFLVVQPQPLHHPIAASVVDGGSSPTDGGSPPPARRSTGHRSLPAVRSAPQIAPLPAPDLLMPSSHDSSSAGDGAGAAHAWTACQSPQSHDSCQQGPGDVTSHVTASRHVTSHVTTSRHVTSHVTTSRRATQDVGVQVRADSLNASSDTADQLLGCHVAARAASSVCVPAGVPLISLTSSSSGSEDGSAHPAARTPAAGAAPHHLQAHDWIDNPLAQVSETWGGESGAEQSPLQSPEHRVAAPPPPPATAAASGSHAGQAGTRSRRAAAAGAAAAGAAPAGSTRGRVGVLGRQRGGRHGGGRRQAVSQPASPSASTAANDLVQALSRLVSAGVRQPTSYTAVPDGLLAAVQQQVAAAGASARAAPSQAVRPEALQVVDLYATGLLSAPRQDSRLVNQIRMNSLPSSPAKLFSSRAWDPSPRPALCLDPQPPLETATPPASAPTSAGAALLADLHPVLAFHTGSPAAKQHLLDTVRQQHTHSSSSTPAAAPADWLHTFRAAASSKSSPSKTNSPAGAASASCHTNPSRPMPGALTSPAVQQQQQQLQHTYTPTRPTAPDSVPAVPGFPAAFHDVDPLTRQAAAMHAAGSGSVSASAVSSPVRLSHSLQPERPMMRPQNQQRLALHVWSKPSIASPTHTAPAQYYSPQPTGMHPAGVATSSFWSPTAPPHVKHHVAPLLAAWQPAAGPHGIGSYWPPQHSGGAMVPGGVVLPAAPHVLHHHHHHPVQGAVQPGSGSLSQCDAPDALVYWHDNPVASPTSRDSPF